MTTWTTSERTLRPRSLEGETAHGPNAHFAGDAVTRNLAGEGKRQRHRVGYRDLPGHVIAADGTVEDIPRIPVGALCPGQGAARTFQRKRRVALPHRRAHRNVPVSVD